MYWYAIRVVRGSGPQIFGPYTDREKAVRVFNEMKEVDREKKHSCFIIRTTDEIFLEAEDGL